MTTWAPVVLKIGTMSLAWILAATVCVLKQIIMMLTLTLFDTIWHWMEFWCRRGTLISCASCFLGVRPRSEASRHWPIFKSGIAGLHLLLGPNYYFVVKIFCVSGPLSIWISLIVHFCDLPSVCIERQELIVLLISFPVNSAARQGGSSNKTHFSSFCRRPRISTSARSFFNDCLAASFAQLWFGIFCSNSHHCCIFAWQDWQL